jgi:hypothetical protein
MSSQSTNSHQANDSSSTKHDIWFDAFNFMPGQDGNIRWLSRPNQQFLHETSSRDAEKFRITFDVENFQSDQIKASDKYYIRMLN